MEHLSLTLFLPSGRRGAKEGKEALNVSFKKKKAVQIRLRSKLNKITNRRVTCLFCSISWEKSMIFPPQSGFEGC